MARSSNILTRLRTLKRKVYSSLLVKRSIILSILAVMAVTVCLGSVKLVYAERNSSDTESFSGYVYEGELSFNQKLPVGLTAGNEEYPELIEIESISFENTYGNAWGAFAKIGWLPVVDSTWKIKAELLDEQGQVLVNARDEAVVFMCKTAQSDQTTMRFAEFELDGMQYQGRRHATRFRITLEPVEELIDLKESTDSDMQTLEVVVVEQSSKEPIPDAVVIVEGSNTYQINQVLYTTDSLGRCEISLAGNEMTRLILEVQKENFATMAKSWTNYSSSSVGRIPIVNLPRTHTFEMLPAYSLGGIVRDEEGNAIEAVRVSFNAYLNDQSGSVNLSRCLQTDADGRWIIEGVPNETDRISIGLRHRDYGGDHGNNRRIEGDALLNAKAFEHIEILKKGITVTGKVLDTDGQPVTGATVMLSQRSATPFFDITDSAGQFRFVCSDDRETYGDIPTVIVEAPGYAPAFNVIDIEPNPEPLEFQLTEGKTIKCRVVDNNAQPIAGAWTVVEPLFANYSDYSIWLEDTDEQGEFEIPNVPDNDIALTVGKEGFIAIRNYTLDTSETEITVLMKRALNIQGTVTDAQTGEPIPNFEIATIYFSSVGARTDNPVFFTDGTYELNFDESSQQTWQIQASAVGYETDVSEVFEIDEDTLTFDFELTRASDYNEATAGRVRRQTTESGVRRITGILKDMNGEPVSEAVISLRSMLHAEETVTDANGEFSLRLNLNSGMGFSSRSIERTGYLLARHIERNLAAAVELDITADNLEINLSPGVIFTGKAVDVNDNGVPDTSISLTFWTSSTGYGHQEPTEIKPDGSFEIRAIPAGFRYSVNARADGYGEPYISVNTSEAVDNRMELEPLIMKAANLTISGIIVDQFDQPISNIRIGAYGNGQPSHYEIYTNTKGQFTIENVCPGPIEIQANSTGSERLHGRLTAEGGDSDIKIVVGQIISGRLIPRQPASLIDKSLPDFENIEINFSEEQSQDKYMLICFFDYEQRPSRNCILELNKKAQELKEKDIVIVTVQASRIDETILNEWIEENDISIPVGVIEENQEQTRFNWGVKSLPWLILTDTEHIVTAEGFGIIELDEKI